MKSQTLHRQQLGKTGEDIATSYLRKQGYRILDRNFKARYGELDIIALHNNILIFIEVKTRIGTAYGTPEEAVTPRKLAEVVKTAQYYVSTHDGLSEALRIDVIGIQLDTDDKVTYFNHLESVT